MQVIRSTKGVFDITAGAKYEGKSIGLVPTMGALHDGHFSLIREARKHNELVVVSIFVNPLQFNKQEDLDHYPRTEKEDLRHLQELDVDIAYLPAVADMYPTAPELGIDFQHMGNVMEGAFRPGHFSGVGVVVAKLFHQTNPTRAYFGLKDLQQYLLIRRMVMDLSFPVEVVGLPIRRESSGLAMSSRNKRLSTSGLETASLLYQGLLLGKSQYEEGASPDKTTSCVRAFYGEQAGIDLEYVELVNPDNLQNVKQNTSAPAVLCVAAYVEGIRLIDNLYLRQD